MSDTIFRDPGISDGEKAVYVCGLADQPPSFDLVSEIHHDSEGYRSIIQASPSAGSFAITVEQVFQRLDGRLRAASYRAETVSGGTVVSREEAAFLGTRHLQIGGGLAPFSVDIMPLAGALTLLRGLDFTEGATAEMDLWLAFSVHLPLSARVEQRVPVEVPAGVIDCWQLRLRPRLAGLNPMFEKILGGFLPPAVVHIEAAPPHRTVRVGFPTGPLPGDPRGWLELVT
ncbi:hypothetical protein [Nocardia sp. NPDC051832]|uniref:hypothetical protein n=1 Tax=Nocardia sp. NPDC051832 TaxID=3155673 RepID=UPI0034315BD1